MILNLENIMKICLIKPRARNALMYCQMVSYFSNILKSKLYLCLESTLSTVQTPNKSRLHREISRQKLNSKIPFSNIYNTKKYKYIITSGNNSKIIREAMMRRWWWIEVTKFNSIFNFKWQPFSNGIIFEDFYKEKVIKQAINHLEYHSVLSEKSQLFECFKSY